MASSFQHIDPRALLDAIGGDHATLAQLVDMFLRATPPSRDALLVALAADERATARRLAHELRGNVIIFGATDLAAELTSLEKTLTAGPVPDAQVARCGGMIEAVLGEMEAIKQK